MNNPSSDIKAIRLVFALDRKDDPLLYDELIRFNRGAKRVSRLRLLAHEGVVGQLHQVAGSAAVRSAHALAPASAVDDGKSGDIFDMPAAADVFAAPLEQ